MAAFTEDQAILEASEKLVRADRRGRDTLEISVLCDGAGVGARRLLQKSLEQSAAAMQPQSVGG